MLLSLEARLGHRLRAADFVATPFEIQARMHGKDAVARAALEAQWVTRLADLLEEDPGVEADLRTLVQEIQAQLPARTASARSTSSAAARTRRSDRKTSGSRR